MKVEYETNDAVRDSIRCLAALAHVPVDDVADAFDHLAESMPATEHMDELLSYFEHTYITFLVVVYEVEVITTDPHCSHLILGINVRPQLMG